VFSRPLASAGDRMTWDTRQTRESLTLARTDERRQTSIPSSCCHRLRGTDRGTRCTTSHAPVAKLPVVYVEPSRRGIRACPFKVGPLLRDAASSRPATDSTSSAPASAARAISPRSSRRANARTLDLVRDVSVTYELATGRCAGPRTTRRRSATCSSSAHSRTCTTVWTISITRRKRASPRSEHRAHT
jgi:hypothetical protein